MRMLIHLYKWPVHKLNLLSWIKQLKENKTKIYTQFGKVFEVCMLNRRGQWPLNRSVKVMVSDVMTLEGEGVRNSSDSHDKQRERRLIN